MNIFQKVKSLNLPPGKYVVVAGSALEGYGIRKNNDIDITVTKDVYENLKGKGWEESVRPDGNTGLVKDKYEIGVGFSYGEYQVPAEDLIKTAKVINGIPFVGLAEIVNFKKARNSEKDKEDIKLIEQYLQFHT